MKVLRRTLAGVAAVLALLTLTTAQVARVAHDQAFDTESFVSLAEELVSTRELRTRITDSLVEKVVTDAGVGASLDPRALRLLGMTAAEVDERVAGVVRTAVGTVLDSPRFAALWSAAARAAHESLTQAINAEASTPAPVTVDLTPMMRELAAALASVPGPLADAVDFPGLVPDDATFTFDFIPADSIDDVRQAADATRILRTASTAASVVLLAGTLLLPVRRRNGIRLASVTAALSAVLVLVARSAGSGAVEEAAGDNAEIAGTVYRVVSDPLTLPATLLLVAAACAVALSFVRRGQASGST